MKPHRKPHVCPKRFKYPEPPANYRLVTQGFLQSKDLFFHSENVWKPVGKDWVNLEIPDEMAVARPENDR